MKLLKPTITLLTGIAVCFAFVVHSDGQVAPSSKDDPLAQEGGGQKGGKRHEESPLEQNMKKLNGGLKRLRRDIKDATKNETSLATILDMENAIQACKAIDPPLAAKKAEADRPKFIAEYRKTLIGVEKDLLDVESALLDGDNAKAGESLKKVATAEDPAHEKFAEGG